MLSESLDGQTAIDHDDCASRIGHVASSERSDNLTHVFGGAPAFLDGEPFLEQLVVLDGDGGSHVGFDDARAHFVNGNFKLTQPDRKSGVTGKSVELGGRP